MHISKSVQTMRKLYFMKHLNNLETDTVTLTANASHMGRRLAG